MSTNFIKRILPIQTFLKIMCGLLLALMVFTAKDLIWPLSWVSIPVLLCLGYATFRIFFELTVNRGRVPTMATCYVARQKIASVIQQDAEARGGGTYKVVDLGSGRGELARCIAKKIPHADVTGIEMAPFPYWESKLIQRIFGPANLFFERRDFWPFDCASFDAVVLYLGPLTTEKMGEKLRKEMKVGSLVISHTYPLLGAWEPIQELKFFAPFPEVFYVYKLTAQSRSCEAQSSRA